MEQNGTYHFILLNQIINNIGNFPESFVEKYKVLIHYRSILTRVQTNEKFQDLSRFVYFSHYDLTTGKKLYEEFELKLKTLSNFIETEIKSCVNRIEIQNKTLQNEFPLEDCDQTK